MTCACGCATPCADPPTRIPIDNPSGLSRIAYRVGAFDTFRRALQAHLPGETDLADWRPTADTDLGMQVLDWWAYLADILTFYNERIANEDYLGTAQQDASVQRLVGLLGYRPRPGIGATGMLAVQAASPAPVVVPAGTAIASQAAPGVPSQTFETTAASTFAPPSSVTGPSPEDLTDPAPAGGPPQSAGPGVAEPPPHAQLIARGGVLVAGVPAVKINDRLLLRSTTWSSANDPAVVVAVTATVTEKDPHGRTNTRVQLSGTDTLPATARAADYTLLRPTRMAHLASMPTQAVVIAATTVVLDAPARYLAAGDPLLIDTPGAGVGASPGTGFDVVRITSYAEALWYADADPKTPTTPKAGDATPVPLVVAPLAVTAHTNANLGGYLPGAASVSVHAGWTEVGALLDTPAATLTALPSTLTLARPPAAAAGVAHPALVEDANGAGASITATPVAGSAELSVAPADPDSAMPPLQTPLRVLWDLIAVTRGATVRDEPLGVGDATAAGQQFVLSKSPVTYLADAPGRSGDGYSSTITLAVGDSYWTEVPSLYGHGPGEAIFETFEDEQGHTHVRFGDGATGRRLPTGAPVSATYRIGSGAAVPPPGTLTQVLTAVSNLQAVRNPVVPGGGADPQPADQTRALAPRSVLTFGRAISGDDYAAVAAAAPGVTRTSAVWQWDDAEQRPTVRVYVGDDPAALASARRAIAAQADPNRPVAVVAAVACRAVLALTVRIDPGSVAADVLAAASGALTGPDGLFAPGVLGLGETLYRSRIDDILCAVRGVLAVHALHLAWQRSGTWYDSAGPRFTPGDGGFFTLAATDLLMGGQVNPDE